MSKRSAIERLRQVTEDLLAAQDCLEAAMDAFDCDAETEQWGMLSDAAEAIDEARGRLRFYCVGCSKNTSGGEYYMVRDEVWAASGLDPNDGMLCLACLERRIRRPLTDDDFAALAPSLECWERHIAQRGQSPAPPESAQLNLWDERPVS